MSLPEKEAYVPCWRQHNLSQDYIGERDCEYWAYKQHAKRPAWVVWGGGDPVFYTIGYNTAAGGSHELIPMVSTDHESARAEAIALWRMSQ